MLKLTGGFEKQPYPLHSGRPSKEVIAMRIPEAVNAFLTALRGYKHEQILAERRVSPRKPCHIRNLYACSGGQEVPLTVKDMSRRGINVLTGERLIPGSCLHIHYHGGTRVTQKYHYEPVEVCMTVLWSAEKGGNHTAGLKFNSLPEDMAANWLAELLNSHGLSREVANYRRSNIRVPVRIPLNWRVLGSEYRHEGTVFDISLDGALIATARPVPVRENLCLITGSHDSFKPFTCRGVVVRSGFCQAERRFLSGLEFERLNDEQLALLRKNLAGLIQVGKMKR